MNGQFPMRRISRHPLFIAFVAWMAARFLSFVYRTSRFECIPADYAQRLDAHVPVIFAMWHGQHFMVPFFRRPQDAIDVLISRHGDGEINARAIAHLGLGLIRGSGDHKRPSQRGLGHKKGGMLAFRAMMRALEIGHCLALTADVPKISRICGIGIIKLAAASGRPIVPISVTTSRRKQLDSWDKATINLPFSRGCFMMGDALYVPEDADEALLESHRAQLEHTLNLLNAQAIATAYHTTKGT